MDLATLPETIYVAIQLFMSSQFPYPHHKRPYFSDLASSIDTVSQSFIKSQISQTRLSWTLFLSPRISLFNLYRIDSFLTQTLQNHISWIWLRLHRSRYASFCYQIDLYRARPPKIIFPRSGSPSRKLRSCNSCSNQALPDPGSEEPYFLEMTTLK